MFKAQHTDIGEAMDAIAEPIRALGALALGTSAASAARASVKEIETVPLADEMVRETFADLEIIGRTIAAAVALAEEHGDDVTAGLLTDRLAFHQKHAWMMRATLS